MPAKQSSMAQCADLSEMNYKTWVAMRYFAKMAENALHTPSFSAINSILCDMEAELSTIAFTPIIPCPATETDKNLVTKAQFDDEACTFLLSCIDEGEVRYKEFIRTRFEEKTKKIFDTIPKTRVTKTKRKKDEIPDIKKETISFMRSIDQGRLRQYNIQDLMSFEITNTSFFLTKENYLKKGIKSEMGTELKKMTKACSLSETLISGENSMLVIDFMAYVKKIQVKKMQVRTYFDMANTLWAMFMQLCGTCQRIDIVFDNYFKQVSSNTNEVRDQKVMILLHQLPAKISPCRLIWTHFGRQQRIKLVSSKCLYNRLSGITLFTSVVCTQMIQHLVNSY